MDDQDQRRVAANEIRFREMNERRRDEDEAFRGEPPTALTIMCECARVDCADEFDVTLVDYRRIRADPRRFLLVSGHELPEVERVVEQLDADRSVVEKVGAGAEVAEGDA